MEPIESRTTNVSSDGFYCFVQERFAVGDRIRCTMIVPTFDAEHPSGVICLECDAKVLRLDQVGAGKCGMACRIEDYKVVSRLASSH